MTSRPKNRHLSLSIFPNFPKCLKLVWYKPCKMSESRSLYPIHKCSPCPPLVTPAKDFLTGNKLHLTHLLGLNDGLKGQLVVDPALLTHHASHVASANAQSRNKARSVARVLWALEDHKVHSDDCAHHWLPSSQLTSSSRKQPSWNTGCKRSSFSFQCFSWKNLGFVAPFFFITCVQMLMSVAAQSGCTNTIRHQNKT